jgi:hypothetical protein
MSYEFFQHMISGEVFAVQLDAHQSVIASVGPISRRDLTLNPGDFAINMSEEDNEWFANQDVEVGTEAGAFRLLEGTELAQVIGRAHDPEG